MKRKYRWAYLGVAGCIIIVNVLFIFIKATPTRHCMTNMNGRELVMVKNYT